VTEEEKELAKQEEENEELVLDLNDPSSIEYLLHLEELRTAIRFHVELIKEEEDRELQELSIECLRYIDEEFDKYLMQGEGMYSEIKDICIKQKLL
jgi:hypothetical protein